jgi:hypothetical protein
MTFATASVHIEIVITEDDTADARMSRKKEHPASNYAYQIRRERMQIDLFFDID